MNIVLVLTHDCNLACRYCYAGAKRSVSMPWETARQALDLAITQARDQFQLGFFGGEPLLQWDLLVRSSEYASNLCTARNLAFAQTVTTNGTLLDVDRAQWFTDNACHVAISIDGTRRSHELSRPFLGGASSFDACMAGLEACYRASTTAEVVMVVDPGNCGWAAESAQYVALQPGVRKVTLNMDFHAVWTEEQLASLATQFDAIADFYRRRYEDGSPAAIANLDGKIAARVNGGLTCRDRCGFGVREWAVAPSGRLYPCERLVGEDTRPDLCIGTVAEGFDGATQALFAARRGRRDPACDSCAIRDRCNHDCGCVNYTLTGDISRPAPLLCAFERLCCAAADRAARKLFADGNPLFLARFYGETFG